MRIHGIRIHNVLSYGEHHNVVEFDKGASRFLQTRHAITQLERESLNAEAAKYLDIWQKDKTARIISIVGKTESNSRESNGSGKSSIFEAISYALFEKLLRETVDKDKDRNKGKSTTSVIREVSPGVYCAEAFVELLFSVNNGLWLLRRGRKASGDSSTAIFRLDCLTDHGFAQQGSRSGHRKSDTGSALKSLIKWDFETFCNSVMFGQSDSGQFMIGTDMVRKNIIINILNLGVVTEYLEECRKRKNSTQQTLDSLQTQLDVLAGKPTDSTSLKASIIALKGQISQLQSMHDQLEKEIVSLRRSEDMAKYQPAMSEANLKLELLNQKRRESESQIQIIQMQLDQHNQKAALQQRDLTSYSTQKLNAQNGLTLMRTQLAAIDLAKINQELEYVKQAKEAKPVRVQQSLDLQAIASKAQFEIGGLKSEQRIKQAQLDERNRLKKENRPVNCPTCGSLATPDHLQAESDRLSVELGVIQQSILDKESVSSKNDAELQMVRGKLSMIDQYLAKESGLTQALENHKRLVDNIALSTSALQTFDETISQVQLELDQTKGEVKKSTEYIAGLKVCSLEEIRPYQEQYNLAKDLADGLSSGVMSIQQVINKSVDQQGSLKRDMDQKLLEIGRLESQVSEAESNGIRVGTIKADQLASQKRLNRLKILEQMYGVDGVQTAIVEKYLPLLNSYLNEYIDIVGGGKIHVAIVTDGRLDGKVELVITGQCGSQSIRLSGGEKIKVRLAISIALGLLAFARSKDVPEFICLDEIIAPVDDLTKEHIFTLLHKLQEHFPMIMVISHDKALQENIAQEVVVNRMRGVSRIEKQYYETRT